MTTSNQSTKAQQGDHNDKLVSPRLVAQGPDLSKAQSSLSNPLATLPPLPLSSLPAPARSQSAGLPSAQIESASLANYLERPLKGFINNQSLIDLSLALKESQNLPLTLNSPAPQGLVPGLNLNNLSLNPLALGPTSAVNPSKELTLSNNNSPMPASDSLPPPWFIDHLPSAPWAQDDPLGPLEAEFSSLNFSQVSWLNDFKDPIKIANLSPSSESLLPFKDENLKPLSPPLYPGPRSINDIRDDFPILQNKMEGLKPLIWFDNAATTQKPRPVIERLVRYYETENSNVHRGAHSLASVATDAYEGARNKVASFIGAPQASNIVFTRGTTEAINLVAHGFVKPRLSNGDEILLTELEHHANIVPWQIIAQQTGALIRVAPTDESGQLIYHRFIELIGPNTKFASFSHVSNALGTVVDITSLISVCRSLGVPTLVDAAQSVAHIPINAALLGCDFLVFSGHKIYGPTGIGALYGTIEALNQTLPWQGGGHMISDVTFERTIYQDPPVRFEAGTPNIAGAVGLGAALDYLSSLGLSSVAQYEESLLRYASSRLRSIDGLKIIGDSENKVSVISFILDGFTPAEVGSFLSKQGVAVRAGHHCAQPILRRFGLEATVRPSLALYNTMEEIDRLVESLETLLKQRFKQSLA